MYAAGKIPGSFFKREGRAGEKGTLTARMIDRPIRPLFPKGWRYETQLVGDPALDRPRAPVRHPRDERRLRRADDLRHPVPDARSARCGSARSTATSSSTPTRRTCSRTTDLDLIVAGTEEAILMVEAGANEIPEAEILDALDIAHDDDQEAVRAPARAAREGRQGEEGRRGRRRSTTALLEQIAASHGTTARRGDPGRGQARAPGRDQGRRGRGARAVRRRPTPTTTPRRARRVQRAFDKLEKTIIRERIAVHKKRPDGRGAERDPAITIESRRRPAHARLGAVHARPDAGAQRRRARHPAGGDAPRHARPGDEKVLLAPLQLPAVLGRGGGPHGRPQAPRHRPRGARRARAGADGPLDRGVPLHRSASSRTSSSPTARPRWPRCAAPRCR